MSKEKKAVSLLEIRVDENERFCGSDCPSMGVDSHVSVMDEYVYCSFLPGRLQTIAGKRAQKPELNTPAGEKPLRNERCLCATKIVDENPEVFL